MKRKSKKARDKISVLSIIKLSLTAIGILVTAYGISVNLIGIIVEATTNFLNRNSQFETKKYEVTFPEKQKCYDELLKNLKVLKDDIEYRSNFIENKLKIGDTVVYSEQRFVVNRLDDSLSRSERKVHPFLSKSEMDSLYNISEVFHGKVKEMTDSCWKPEQDIQSQRELMKQKLINVEDAYSKYKNYLSKTLRNQLFKENQ
jgi:hypothetical protein